MNEQTNKPSVADPTKAVVVRTWSEALRLAEPKMMDMLKDPTTVKRELGFAFAAMEKSDALKKCAPMSILNAVIDIARTGLTLNPIYKFAYLIPRKGQCSLDVSYQGMAKTLVDAGAVTVIEAFPIYRDEVSNGRFRFNPATKEVHYDPIYTETEDAMNKRMTWENLHGCLSMATLTDGTIHPFFLPKWKIQKSMRISPGSSGNDSPWKNFIDEMWKKTAIKAHYKVLPKGNLSENAENIIQLEEHNNPVDFSKGGDSSKIADDVFTEDIDAEIKDEETKEPLKTEEAKPSVSTDLRKRITGMKDYKTFVAYVIGLTHLHDVDEFREMIILKMTELQGKKEDLPFLLPKG